MALPHSQTKGKLEPQRVPLLLAAAQQELGAAPLAPLWLRSHERQPLMAGAAPCSSKSGCGCPKAGTVL